MKISNKNTLLSAMIMSVLLLSNAALANNASELSEAQIQSKAQVNNKSSDRLPTFNLNARIGVGGSMSNPYGKSDILEIQDKMNEQITGSVSLDLGFGTDIFYGRKQRGFSSIRLNSSTFFGGVDFLTIPDDASAAFSGLSFTGNSIDISFRFGGAFGIKALFSIMPYIIIDATFMLSPDKTNQSQETTNAFSGINFGQATGAGLMFMPTKVPVGVYAEVKFPIYFANLTENMPEGTSFIFAPKADLGLQFGI